MSHTVKDAKNNLSNLIRLAEKGKPQIIKRQDKDVAVVVSISDWNRKSGTGKVESRKSGKQETLLEFLQNSPLDLILDDLDNRQQDAPRESRYCI